MAQDALIGHTGFVGSTLVASNWNFGALFNSRNFEKMRGRRFGTVICAGVNAVKWLANKEPEADWRSIETLQNVLETVDAERFVLVSTVDVYPRPIDVNEDDVPIRGEGQPYGRHRVEFEHFVREHFSKCQIIRLPALFGHGLRKNVIFDLLTGNLPHQINPNGYFQWYPMRRFADDLRRVIKADVSLLNVAVEPLCTRKIVTCAFPGVRIGADDMPAMHYDMRTRHAALLGGAGNYHINAEESLEEIMLYVDAVSARGGRP